MRYNRGVAHLSTKREFIAVSLVARMLIFVVAAVLGAGCQPAPPPPTIAPSPSASATPAPLLPPPVTRSARSVVSPTPPPPPSATSAPFSPTPQPSATPALIGEQVLVGRSVEGREIYAHWYGTGARRVLLVGGIHGGWERNTTALMQALREHLQSTPSAVLPQLSVGIIPLLNPDGAARGAVAAGRFNGNGVDLNRNWGCGWQPQAVWRNTPVNAGNMPFSEPETQTAATYIQAVMPEVLLFYHSAADGIFAGDCAQRGGAWHSGTMSAVYGAAAGYTFGQPFTAYPVTGTAPSWADGLGIAAADVELSGTQSPEFERNLRGLMAVQCWMLAGGAGIPACDALAP